MNPGGDRSYTHNINSKKAKLSTAGAIYCINVERFCFAAIVATNYCRFDFNIDVAGQFHAVPINGSIVVFTPPGEHAVSATAGGKKLVCGGGGCSVQVTEGKYKAYPCCARPSE